MATERYSFMRVSDTAEGAGIFHSLWKVAGMPGAGATPAAMPGAVPTNATAGAIPFTNAASAASKNVLDRLAAGGSVVGTLVLYDRLWHGSGLDGTLGTAQTINSVALTRPDANGANVELWIEWYSATGATPRNVTAKYTNQDGTASRNTPSVAFAVSPSVGQLQQLPLQAGDSGVRTVEELTLSGSTGTAGDFGLTLLRRVGEVPLNVANVMAEMVAKTRRQVYDNACLAMAVLCSATSSGLIIGAMELLEVPG